MCTTGPERKPVSHKDHRPIFHVFPQKPPLTRSSPNLVLGTICIPNLRFLRLRVFRPGNGSPSATNGVLLGGVVVVSTEAFSFRNRSTSNFAYILLTVFSRTAQRTQCRIFKLSPK